jgi:hypothetical protein
MKSAGLAVAVVVALVAPVIAQDDQAALAKKRDDKLAQPWVKAGGWIADFDKAVSEARKSGKPILAYFTLTASAAPYCQKVESSVFSDPKFAEMGKSYVLFLHITSGVKKDKNQDLAKKRGGDGFPYTVWLDTDGNLLCGTDNWTFQNQRGVVGLDQTGKRVAWYLDVKKKAAGGGNPEKIDLLLADVELGRTKLADAEKRLANLGALTDDQKTLLEGLRVKDEVRPTIDPFIQKGASDNDQIDAGKKFLAIKKAGRPAPPFAPYYEFYWRCILVDAQKEKDAAAFEEALKALKARFGDDRGSSLYYHFGTVTWKAYFERQDGVLAELKK